MPIILTVTAGPHKGLEFSFDKHDTFLVGRSKHAHFQLRAKDKFFSRIHFMMEVNPPHCRLIDMGSHNGTYVNGEQVLAVDLKHNDQIRAGHTILRVKVAHDGAQPPSTATLNLNPSEAAIATLPHIPGFRIEREIGRGTLGATYLAQREGSPSAFFALKVVQPSFEGSPAQIDAFMQAARFLTQLDHPHLVRLRDLDVCAGGFYFVSDYVAGQNAAQLLQRDGPISVKRAIRWASQILQALQYTHARHFIHRDIKPANVLIEEKDGKEIVKLTDFGLAHVYQSAPFSGLALTPALVNLASFMPPEVLFRYQEVNPLADQYSVAAVLYHLLTGEEVLQMPSGTQKRYSSLLRRQYRPIRELRGDVPPAVANAIHQALSRTPLQRFPGVAEFRQALLRAGQGD